MIKRKSIVSIKGLKYRVRRQIEADMNSSRNEGNQTSSNVQSVFENIEEVQDLSIQNANPEVHDDQLNVVMEENDSFIHIDTNDSSFNQKSSISIENVTENIIVNEHFKVVRCIREFIQKWSIEYNVQRSALTIMLRFLNNFFPTLPKDSRTLLKTPKKGDVIDVSPGKYYHMGLEQQLTDLIRKSGRIPNQILLAVNMDGVPIFKNSQENNFWMVLVRAKEISRQVLPIGIYRGATKPDDFNQFMLPFVMEFNYLKSNYSIDGKKICLKLKFFSMDAPAKCAALGISYFNAQKGCPRCDIIAHTIEGLNVLIGEKGPRRTNDAFRRHEYENFHKFYTVLEEIEDLDLVESFAVDYLHVVLLGAVKKLLKLWFGDRGIYYLEKGSVSARLLELNDYKPMEFCRNFREIKDFARYKGTELRTFLLYSGVIVLKNIISSRHYDHFLKLHTAIRILTDVKLAGVFVDVADQLLKDFVLEFETHYGQKSVSHNIHMLLHLAEDVKKFGPLDKFSAFPFENFMTPIKDYVHSNNFVLEQVVKRVQEQLNASHIDSVKNTRAESEINLIWKKTTLEIKFKGLKFDQTQHNKYFLTKNKEVYEITQIFIENNQVFFQGNLFANQTFVYHTPINSTYLNIYQCDSVPVRSKTINLNEICCKLFAIPSSMFGRRFLNFFPIRADNIDY